MAANRRDFSVTYPGRSDEGHRRKLAFIFSGQGSQWSGMGRSLFEQDPVFRGTLQQCDELMSTSLDWSLLKVITEVGNKAWPNRIDIIQPMLFAIQISLAAVWRSWSIQPDVVVGHSMGEVAAAHVAGALDLKDAVQIICRRSLILKRASGTGAMVAVRLSIDQALEAIAGYEDCVAVAACNSPTSTVLSGEQTALEQVINRLKLQHVFCHRVNVDVASHSQHMTPFIADLMKAIEGFEPRPTSVPIYSTVTGDICPGENFDASYWVRNLRDSVQFSTVVERLMADDIDIFLEISPHPVLLPAIQEGLLHHRREGTLLPSLCRKKEEQATMLASLSVLRSIMRPDEALLSVDSEVYSRKAFGRPSAFRVLN